MVAGGNVFSIIIFRLPLLPYCIDGRLKVHFGHDLIGHVSGQVHELLLRQPGSIHSIRLAEEILNAPAQFPGETFHKSANDHVAHLPQRKVTGVILPAAGDALVLSVLPWHLQKLPDGPGVAIHDQLQKRVVPNHVSIFLARQQLFRIARQFQICRPLPHQMLGQRVKQRQQPEIAGRRYADIPAFPFGNILDIRFLLVLLLLLFLPSLAFYSFFRVPQFIFVGFQMYKGFIFISISAVIFVSVHVLILASRSPTL